ncbi:MAG: hypothetical protein IJZ53_06585 [Tyzzerella sp.]|nr:hypothetical protein [Tyzzerella sp.]
MLNRGRAEGHAEGQREGDRNRLVSIVQKKLKRGDSVEKIADDLVEDVAEIREIVDNLRENG